MAARKSAKKAKKPVRAVRRAPPAARTDAADRSLRDHVLDLLKGGGAHLDFDKAITGLPEGQRGAKPQGLPFTAWRLLEHMRIAQSDILEFSRDAKHVSPAWPEGYWPECDAPPSASDWDRSVAAFRSDRKAIERLVADPKTDLHARIPHGDGQTILREALLIADHDAYHLGQLVILRRLLGSWRD